jgi:hypothetical protein
MQRTDNLVGRHPGGVLVGAVCVTTSHRFMSSAEPQTRLFWA